MRYMPAKSANYFSEAGFTSMREKTRATFILLFATAGEGEVVHHGTEDLNVHRYPLCERCVSPLYAIEIHAARREHGQGIG
jgi:hypothetical protein